MLSMLHEHTDLLGVCCVMSCFGAGIELLLSLLLLLAGHPAGTVARKMVLRVAHAIGPGALMGSAQRQGGLST
jgi:hypothetical protein